MPCSWEGNRRSGVALAMRHRLQWFIHLRGDEHRAYSPYGIWHISPPLSYYDETERFSNSLKCDKTRMRAITASPTAEVKGTKQNNLGHFRSSDQHSDRLSRCDFLLVFFRIRVNR